MAARLKQARVRAGFRTAKDATNRHRLEYPTYAGHENGSRGFHDDVEKYARIFQVDEKWLLTGRGAPSGSVADEVVELYRAIPDSEKPEALSYLKWKARKH